MIPDDDLPGAREAGTAGQLFQAMENAPVMAGLMLAGARALDASADAAFGVSFAAASSGQRQLVMDALSRGEAPDGWPVAGPPARVFWSALRGAAVSLFYGSEPGRAVTGFPGPVVERGGYVSEIVERPPSKRA
jgi:hypothetical protein